MPVPPLNREDPLEEGMAAHSSILAWGIPVDRGAREDSVHRVTESDTTERDTQGPEAVICRSRCLVAPI